MNVYELECKAHSNLYILSVLVEISTCDLNVSPNKKIRVNNKVLIYVVKSVDLKTVYHCLFFKTKHQVLKNYIKYS